MWVEKTWGNPITFIKYNIRDSDIYLFKSNNVVVVHRAVGGNNSFLTVCTDKSFE